MSNEEPPTSPATGRRPRQGVGGSPVASTLSIVLAVVAVIAGFLILRNITDDGSDGATSGTDPSATAPTTTIDALPTTVATTTSTTMPLVTEGATVVVANANTVGGSAGRMTRTLETAGFTMGEPTNATEVLDDSLVYYDSSVAAAEAVAQSVARVMGGLEVTTVPSPPPTEDGTLNDGGVLVMLGNNEADKTLEELNPTETTTPATGTAPAPSGDDEGDTGDTDTTEAPAETDPAETDTTEAETEADTEADTDGTEG